MSELGRVGIFMSRMFISLSGSKSFIIMLRRPIPSLSFRPLPPGVSTSSELSLKPFSAWPQSLRCARYGRNKVESMRPRYPSVMYDRRMSGRTRKTLPSWRMNSNRSVRDGIENELMVSW